MKIVSLVAENIKRLTVVEIKPDGNLVQITGPNGSGKTSVLDSIWWALAGASHIQSAPIRRGANEARIRLDLGELIVTRTFLEGRPSTIRVERADGFQAKSPQDMLNSLLGALTFDPLAFTRAKPKDQFETLREFVPGVDFEALDGANRTDFTNRTDVNRSAKQARAATADIKIPEGITDETALIDEQALTVSLADAGEHNAQLQRRAERRQNARDQIALLPDEISGLEKSANDKVKASQSEAERRSEEISSEIERLQRLKSTLLETAQARENEIAAQCAIDIADARAATAKLQETLDTAEPLPKPIDVVALTEQIADARRINQGVHARDARAKMQQRADELEADAVALTKAIADRETDKQKAIAAAELPVPGLGLGDGIVTMNGLPFDQASDAEQLRVSIAIAMASNPKLRVIRVRDGSLLDEKALALLAEMANEKDYQVWIEKVDTSGTVGIVMEDGHVRAAPSK